MTAGMEIKGDEKGRRGNGSTVGSSGVGPAYRGQFGVPLRLDPGAVCIIAGAEQVHLQCAQCVIIWNGGDGKRNER
jgi:hypothetical protein